MTPHDALAEALERLEAWVDDVQLSTRTGVPHYKNPGALKEDIRAALAALRAGSGDSEPRSPHDETLREAAERVMVEAHFTDACVYSGAYEALRQALGAAARPDTTKDGAA